MRRVTDFSPKPAIAVNPVEGNAACTSGSFRSAAMSVEASLIGKAKGSNSPSSKYSGLAAICRWPMPDLIVLSLKPRMSEPI